MRHPHGTLTLRREDGRVVCERVRVADTWVRRLRGALFRRSLPSEEGCVLRPSFSIHTMFMQFPIDVVFLDQDLNVLKISANVKPFHAASCRGAREVVELRAGECERRGLSVGDRVAWASHQKSSSGVPAAVGTTVSDLPPTVIVASSDERFVKLLRLLLDARDVNSHLAVKPRAFPHELESSDTPRAVMLDVADSAADGLAAENAFRALNPDVPIFLVAEPDTAARAPIGTRIYDKWADPEALVEAVIRTFAEAPPA
jgi:uncharacterized protein